MIRPTFGNPEGIYPFPLRVSPSKAKRWMEEAEPYREDALMRGKGSNIYVRQFKFPFEYREDEQAVGHYTDRLITQDPGHFTECFQKYVDKSIQTNLLQWFRTAEDPMILGFLKAVLRADESVIWTGFRITGQADPAIGPPIFWLHLFAKNPESDTKVYTGPQAPNVKKG